MLDLGGGEGDGGGGLVMKVGWAGEKELGTLIRGLVLGEVDDGSGRGGEESWTGSWLGAKEEEESDEWEEVSALVSRRRRSSIQTQPDCVPLPSFFFLLRDPRTNPTSPKSNPLTPTQQQPSSRLFLPTSSSLSPTKRESRCSAPFLEKVEL